MKRLQSVLTKLLSNGGFGWVAARVLTAGFAISYLVLLTVPEAHAFKTVEREQPQGLIPKVGMTCALGIDLASQLPGSSANVIATFPAQFELKKISTHNPPIYTWKISEKDIYDLAVWVAYHQDSYNKRMKDAGIHVVNTFDVAKLKTIQIGTTKLSLMRITQQLCPDPSGISLILREQLFTLEKLSQP